MGDNDSGGNLLVEFFNEVEKIVGTLDKESIKILVEFLKLKDNEINNISVNKSVLDEEHEVSLPKESTNLTPETTKK